LTPVVAGDLRRLALGARQDETGANAPLRLVFVADVDKLEHTSGFEEPGLHDPEVQRSAPAAVRPDGRISAKKEKARRPMTRAPDEVGAFPGSTRR